MLIGFTVALPFSIGVYMFIHRGKLYSMSVYQRVGFLYDPYNRSAPWWAIHDVILKMLLTGMLIYVPGEERAGIAVILCTVAIVNLNYFRPHKSLVMFWLNQFSFVVTSIKYVFALILSSIQKEAVTPSISHRVERIGMFFIVVDVLFIIATACSIYAAGLSLYRKMQALKTSQSKEQTDETLRNLTGSKANQRIKMKSAEDDMRKITVARRGSNDTVIKDIQATFETHERALQFNQSKWQSKSRRRTEMRLAARLKIKKSRCLQKVPIFSSLSEAGIEAMLNCTKHSKVKQGTVLCREGDVADEFFIFVNGRVAVTVEQPAVPGSSERGMMSFRVGTLRELDVAGENAVVGVGDPGFEGGQRGATLVAESEWVELLRLSTEDWRELITSGVMGREIVSGVESGLAKRTKDNEAAMAAEAGSLVENCGVRKENTSASSSEAPRQNPISL